MRGLACLCLAALGSMAVPAEAVTTRSFTVGAKIAQGCLIVTTGGQWGAIDLGSRSGLGGQTASADLLSGGLAGIQIDCTPGSSISIVADQGNNGAGGTRRLVNANDSASLLPYTLYANGSTTAWTTQALPMSFAANAQHLSLPVRAVATWSGPTRAGAYSDTVRVTISW